MTDEPVRCRSCGAEIFYATTTTGKAMPLDVDPHPDGNVIVERQDGRLGCRVLGNAAPAARDEVRYRSHFATCPNAAAHRRR